ncbi:MAG: hypothetical protein IJ144_03095 [Prevotella sp.]|nr:hypothetical protein [Prevotella sp.]
MRRPLALMLTAFCLLSACQRAETPSSATIRGDGGQDSAAVYQDWAYREMFDNALDKAEAYAYRSVMLSNDSTMEYSSLVLLCYIYYREGKQEQLQMLMQTISPENYADVMDVQWQVEQVRADRDRRYYAAAIILLLLISGVVCYWYIRRMRTLAALYRQRMDSVRREMLSKESNFTNSAVLPIGEAKQGIDVLFAIINDQNISQMGKQEEQAVLHTLPMVDASLAALLDKASAPLTPKETFFCIMEYYGKSDRQKACSFCCSEQAIRSTKSRLSKKIDIAILRSA